jgi:hypothetical protein
MKPWPLAVLPLLGILGGGCLLTSASLAIGEGQIEACDGLTYDNLDGRPYRIWRAGKASTAEARLTFDITQSCKIANPEDLSGLGIRALWIENARSAEPILAAEIDSPSAGVGAQHAAPLLVCKGRLEESGEMILHCPPAAGGIAYHLAPSE